MLYASVARINHGFLFFRKVKPSTRWTLLLSTSDFDFPTLGRITAIAWSNQERSQSKGYGALVVGTLYPSGANSFASTLLQCWNGGLLGPQSETFACGLWHRCGQAMRSSNVANVNGTNFHVRYRWHLSGQQSVRKLVGGGKLELSVGPMTSVGLMVLSSNTGSPFALHSFTKSHAALSAIVLLLE